MNIRSILERLIDYEDCDEWHIHEPGGSSTDNSNDHREYDIDKAIHDINQLITEARVDELRNIQEWYGGQYEAMTSVTGYKKAVSSRIEELVESSNKETK